MYIKNKLSNVNFNIYLMYILLLTFCIPNFNVLNIFGYNIKIFRVVLLLSALGLFFKKNVDFFPSKKIFYIFVYMLVVTAISYFFWGFDRLIFDYGFAYLIILVLYNYGKNIKYNEWLNIIQTCSIFMLMIVLVNIFTQRSDLINYFKNSSNQHPKYDSIFPGGLNLESTWIAMFSIFFVKKPLKAYIYLIFSFLISIVFSSRVGLIINALSLLFVIYNQLKGFSKGDIINACIIIFTLSVLILIILIITGIANKMIDRVFEIGSDGGSQGRLNIWKNIFSNFIKNPLGYGVGNAMSIVKKNSTQWFGEDNVHNIYFQMLLDIGFIGCAYFINIVYNFIKKNKKLLFNNPIVYFILLYLVIGFIQFKGAEILVYYIISIYLVLSKSGELYE